MKETLVIDSEEVRRVRRKLNGPRRSSPSGWASIPLPWPVGKRASAVAQVFTHGRGPPRPGARLPGPRMKVPSPSSEEAKLSALSHLLRTFFDGSTAKAVSALVARETLSDQDLDDLASLIGGRREPKRESDEGHPSDLALHRHSRWALPLLAKASFVLAVASVVAWTMRRTSASARHVVWALALGTLVGLPLLSISFPDGTCRSFQRRRRLRLPQRTPRPRGRDHPPGNRSRIPAIGRKGGPASRRIAGGCDVDSARTRDRGRRAPQAMTATRRRRGGRSGRLPSGWPESPGLPPVPRRDDRRLSRDSPQPTDRRRPLVDSVGGSGGALGVHRKVELRKTDAVAVPVVWVGGDQWS